MIIIDGDSVALATRPSVYAHQTWWARLHHKVIVLATPAATSAECLSRVHEVIEAMPSHYILMVGQWAHNHEDREQFRNNVSDICRELMKKGIQVILVTPPYQDGKYAAVHEFSEEIKRIAAAFYDSGVKLVDLWTILEKLDIYDETKCHLGVTGNKLLAEHIMEVIE